MHAFRRLWESATHENSAHAIFGFDHEADVNSVQMLYCAFTHRMMREDDAAKLGVALHYLYGASAGSAYALLSTSAPSIRAGFGTFFGAWLWLVSDELPISVLRISHPLEKSAASHGAALASHLLFGATLEALIEGQLHAW